MPISRKYNNANWINDVASTVISAAVVGCINEGGKCPRCATKLKNQRTGRLMAVQNPVFFLARDRNLAEEAWPGDIIGIPNHGTLRLGDTLTEGADIRVTGLPSFAPELLRRVHIEDPMRSKHLRNPASPVTTMKSSSSDKCRQNPASSRSFGSTCAPRST